MAQIPPELSHLIEAVMYARNAGKSLNIVGAGTKCFYGEEQSGEPCDVRRLSGICSYEPSELVITARAGTPLEELETVLAEQNQYFAFEPPRFATGSTVGGVVAAGLSGPARLGGGGIRDFVLGATMINGKGEYLTFGGQVMKNVAGYDVSRLLAGSMGILGVICEVSLKVLPIHSARITLVVDRDEEAALSFLTGLARQALPVNASAWHDGKVFLRLSGASSAVEEARKRLGGTMLDPGEASAWWDAVRDHRHAFFTRNDAPLWRISLPAVAQPLKAANQFIEWGGALRWLYTDDPIEGVREMASALGGHATLFRDPHRRSGVFTPPSSVLLEIHRNLKHAFDPDGIFNVGRLYPGL
ncbi:glycolate oxidase subunit GlcE [Cupriavidus necator]